MRSTNGSVEATDVDEVLLGPSSREIMRDPHVSRSIAAIMASSSAGS